MTKEQAKNKAQTKVFLYMNIGDIEQECINMNIPISKNRHTMEKKLIEAYITEWT